MENFLLECTVNGDKVSVTVPASATLLYVLREVLKLTGTKEGCGEGECGACTVLVNGQNVNTCIFPAISAQGADNLTIEGV